MLLHAWSSCKFLIILCQQIATNVRSKTTDAQLTRSVWTRLDLTRAIAPLGTLEGQEIVKVIYLFLRTKTGVFSVDTPIVQHHILASALRASYFARYVGIEVDKCFFPFKSWWTVRGRCSCSVSFGSHLYPLRPFVPSVYLRHESLTFSTNFRPEYTLINHDEASARRWELWNA